MRIINFLDTSTNNIECSNKSYVVMEKEKFDYDEFYKFARLEELTGIITEDEIMPI